MILRFSCGVVEVCKNCGRFSWKSWRCFRSGCSTSAWCRNIIGRTLGRATSRRQHTRPLMAQVLPFLTKVPARSHAGGVQQWSGTKMWLWTILVYLGLPWFILVSYFCKHHCWSVSRQSRKKSSAGQSRLGQLSCLQLAEQTHLPEAQTLLIWSQNRIFSYHKMLKTGLTSGFEPELWDLARIFQAALIGGGAPLQRCACTAAPCSCCVRRVQRVGRHSQENGHLHWWKRWKVLEIWDDLGLFKICSSRSHIP